MNKMLFVNSIYELVISDLNKQKEKLCLIISIQSYNGFIDYVDKTCTNLFKKSIIQSIEIINKLPRIDQLPAPKFTRDGEILLIWNINNNKKAMITFYGTEEYGYTYKINGVFVSGKEVAKFQDDIPKDLCEYLNMNC